jgi:hypothetical protein
VPSYTTNPIRVACDSIASQHPTRPIQASDLPLIVDLKVQSGIFHRRAFPVHEPVSRNLLFGEYRTCEIGRSSPIWEPSWVKPCVVSTRKLEGAGVPFHGCQKSPLVVHILVSALPRSCSGVLLPLRAVSLYVFSLFTPRQASEQATSSGSSRRTLLERIPLFSVLPSEGHLILECRTLLLSIKR